MEILIRPWRRGDFPAVRRILWESWIAAYRTFIPEEDLRTYFEATYQIDSLARLYDNPRVHGFIGEADGEAVGYARTQFHVNENRLYLASLYLLPAFQGKGIGGDLLRAAEENALAYGLRELWVGVMVRNEAAGRWYDRRGFRFVREEPFRMGRTTVAHLIGCKAIREPVGDAALRRGLSAVYPGKGDSSPLFEVAAGFLDRQKEEWPGLAEGYAALEAAPGAGDPWRTLGREGSVQPAEDCQQQCPGRSGIHPVGAPASSAADISPRSNGRSSTGKPISFCVIPFRSFRGT